MCKTEAAVRNLAPVGTREDAHALKILGFELHFPPYRVRRQFAPEVSASAEEQCAAQHVFVFIVNIAVKHQMLKLHTIPVELLAIELILQEFGYPFRFSCRP